MGSGSDAARRRAYREATQDAVREGLSARPWEQLLGQVLLGGTEWVRQVRAKLAGEDKERPALRALRLRPGWEQVVRAVEEVKGERWEEFRDRRGDWGRDLALWLGRSQAGLKLAALGRLAGGLDYRTVGWAVKRVSQRWPRDPELARATRMARAHIQNPEI